MHSLRVFTTVGIVISLCRITHADTQAEIYQRRVVPLLQSSKASSCSECHLQGVKLEDFLSTDPKKSFASLRSLGWIDVDHPSESKLLQFIAKKPDKSSELMDRVRQSELDAIGQWIHAAVRDPDSLNTPLPKLNDLKLDETLIRHARKDRVLNRFVEVVWSQFERCANCHSPDRNAKQVQKNGAQMSWIVPNSPSETLQLLTERKLINIETPRASLLKTKALGQEHGGGVKFPAEGQTDREWGGFLDDYAAMKGGLYKTAENLPKFDSIRTWRTGLHLRIEELPQLPAGQYAVILMHRIKASGTVDEEPIAMGEGRVSKDGKSWSSTLMILEPSQQRKSKANLDWGSLLPDSGYQLRWIVVDDSKSTLQEIIAMRSTAQIKLESLWKAGHSTAKTILFGAFESLEVPK